MTDRTLPGRAGPHPPPGQPPPATAARRLEPPPWLGVTQGLRLPWLVAIVAVCAVGVVLADLEGSARPRLLLLLAAPLLPMLCVAGSYSGKADPFAEVTRTTPAGGLRILLMRTCQVLTLCVPLLTVAAALMPRGGLPLHTSVGWLLPCLTLTLATLLLSSYVGSWAASLLTSCGWLLVVALLAKPYVEHKGRADWPDRMAMALGHVQLKFVDHLVTIALGAVSAVLAELLVLRRHAFSRPESR